MSDARHQRSRKRLEQAVLRLAQDGPIHLVTMSALATEAGVNRSTVYEHTTSPEALLHEVLLGQLDDLRTRHLVDIAPVDLESASDAVLVGVLAHLDDNRAIYRQGLGDDRSPGPLLAVLTGHFRESVRLLIAHGEVVLPPDAPATEVAARYVGDGTAAAAAVWLDLPEPRDVSDFVGRFRALRPSWWRTSSPTG